MVNLSLSDLEAFDPKNKKNRFCCPICGNSKSIEQKHRSIWVDRKTGVWICHRCENKGLLIEWQKQPSITNNLASNYSPKEKSLDEKKLKLVKSEYQSFARGFAYSPGQNYLMNRGISSQLAKESGCGFGYWKHWFEQENGQYSFLKDKRVCFPVSNQDGEVVAISARAISDDYLEPKQIVKGYKSLGVFSTPGGLTSNNLIITEAPIDALSLAMADFPSIATVGTSWPDWLIDLAINKELVLVAFDNDDAGNKASSKLIDQLSKLGVKANRLLPTRKDWNEILLADGLNSLKSQINDLVLDYYPTPSATTDLSTPTYSLISY